MSGTYTQTRRVEAEKAVSTVVGDLTQDLRTERSAIADAGRFRSAQWVVLVVTTMVTLAAWQASSRSIEARVRAEFDREAGRVVAQVDERMMRYVDGLNGGVAAIKANGDDMSRTEWQAFARSLQIEVQYPGVNGIGMIHQVKRSEFDDYLGRQRVERPYFGVHPDHAAEVMMPITYIEPEAANSEAVGLDMTHEQNRLQGLLAARDTGLPRITAPITLVQDETQTPGFLLYSPFYSTDEVPSTVDGRRENFVGAVYAPFVVKNLMEGTLSLGPRQVGVTISDGSNVIYDENHPGSARYDPNARYERLVESEIYGRLWRFDIRSDRNFAASTRSLEPLLVLAGGLLLDALLFALFVAMVRSNRRAARFGDDLLAELSLSHRRLVESNDELERFAYVASHDLQTPLRGLGDLVEYLEEDLNLVVPPDADRTAIDHNLERVRCQTERMTTLIRGVLDYSRIGGDFDSGPPSVLDLPMFAADMTSDLDLAVGQIAIAGIERVEVDERPRLLQVLQNLVANAFDHHPRPESAKVTVSAEMDGECLVFSVADDGNGIAPQYHERIFELFQSLSGGETRTGLGLAIVKKIVERRGGTVSVSSRLGDGTTFIFTWPGRPQARPANKAEVKVGA